MRVRFLVGFVAAALLMLAGCDVAVSVDSQRYRKDVHYSYSVKPGARISVDTFNGQVEITGWDQDTVDIDAVKLGPTQAAADALQVDVKASADEVSLRAIRPASQPGRSGVQFSLRVPRTAVLDLIATSNAAIRSQGASGPGRLRTSNGPVRVQDFKGNIDVQTSNAPVDIENVGGRVTVHSSNGRIRAEGLQGEVEAETSNAAITASVAATVGPVRLSTSNGGVTLSLPAAFADSVRAETNNGPITLRLPGEPNFRVHARTTNASVSSDFEIKGADSGVRNRADGAIGNGGPTLDLQTSNGAIRLSRM